MQIETLWSSSLSLQIVTAITKPNNNKFSILRCGEEDQALWNSVQRALTQSKGEPPYAQLCPFSVYSHRIGFNPATETAAHHKLR